MPAVQNSLQELAPLPLNSVFSVTLSHDTSEGPFTGLPLYFYLDVTSVTGGVTRVTLDETDAVLSNSDYTVTFTKNGSWTGDSFVQGTVQGYLFVNGRYDQGVIFSTYTLPAGEVNP